MVLRGLRRPYSGCYRQRPPRSLQRHPAREPDHPRRAIAGAQRRCCPRPCEQPALLVFLNTIQVTRTPHVFFFAPCSPDEPNCNGTSQCRSIDEPAANFRGGSSGGSGRGRAARGVSPWSSFCCLRFSFARRLPLPASAPASAPVSAARRSVGGLARACGARHARARLRRGGGGGDGARRGGRLVVFLAPRVARCCTGAGSVWALPRFFSRSVRTPDARGRSGWSSGR